MPQIQTIQYAKFVLQKDDLLFLNRIELTADDVLRFLRSVLSHAKHVDKHGILYDVGMEYSGFKILEKKGKFVQIFANSRSSNWELIGHKGFAFEAVFYNLQGKCRGKYIVFYQPYSLEYFLVKKSCIKMRYLCPLIRFDPKPVVKYVFTIGEARVKRYFWVGRHQIRAYSELILARISRDE